jgi:hypothetical protein
MTDNLPAHPEDVADVMLSETMRSTPTMRFKKGTFLNGKDEVPPGREYIAHPFETRRGFVLWDGNRIVEQRLGRIRDRFALEREDLPADQDWQMQRVMPLEDAETGELLCFVTSAQGGALALNMLINATARRVKSGRGDATPRVRLGVSTFSTKSYGEIQRPDFIIVDGEQKEMKVIEPTKKEKTRAELDDEIPF